MKKLFTTFTLFFFVTLCLRPTFAQYEPYTQIGLPEGAIARFGKGYIQGIEYSPDGTRLAVTTAIGVWIYDTQTGEELNLITGGHTDRVYSAAYSPDGKIIATGSWDDTLRLWDTRTGKNIKTFKGYTFGISSVAYSPDGSTIAIHNFRKHTIELLNAHTGKHLKTLIGHEDPSALYEGHPDASIASFTYSPDGKTIVSGGGDKTVRLWNVHSGENIRTLTGHIEAVRAVAYSPDGDTIVSASRDKTVRLWDAHTGENIKTLKGHKDIIVSVAYSPDSNIIVSGGWDGMLHRWDAQTGQPLKTYEVYTGALYFARGHGGAITHTAYSPDDKTIATAGADGTMKWWDAHTGDNINTFTEYVSGSRAIIYSPDGKTIAVTAGGKVNLWDASGKHLKTLTGHKGYVTSIRFSPNGQTLITGGSADKTVKYWNIHTGENIDTLNSRKQQLWDTDTREYLKTFDDDVYGRRWFVFSPDRKILATRFNDSVRLHDVHKGNIIQILIGHTGRPQRGVFSSDSSKIITYAKDNTVRLWDTNTGKNIKTLTTTEAPVSVMYPVNGDPLAISVKNDSVSIWNIAKAKHLRTVKASAPSFFGIGKPRKSLGQSPHHIRKAMFSPNGETLVIIKHDETVQLLNVNKGKRIGKLIKPLNDNPLKGTAWVKYSPDGKTFLTTQIGNFGGTPRLWDAKTGKHLKTLKGHTYCRNSFFSPDSKIITTRHDDGTLILWDIPTR